MRQLFRPRQSLQGVRQRAGSDAIECQVDAASVGQRPQLVEERVVPPVVNDRIGSPRSHNARLGIRGHGADNPCSEMLEPLDEKLTDPAGCRVDQHTVARPDLPVLADKVLCSEGLEQQRLFRREGVRHRNGLGRRDQHLRRVGSAHVDPRDPLADGHAMNVLADGSDPSDALEPRRVWQWELDHAFPLHHAK